VHLYILNIVVNHQLFVFLFEQSILGLMGHIDVMKGVQLALEVKSQTNLFLKLLLQLLQLFVDLDALVLNLNLFSFGFINLDMKSLCLFCEVLLFLDRLFIENLHFIFNFIEGCQVSFFQLLGDQLVV